MIKRMRSLGAEIIIIALLVLCVFYFGNQKNFTGPIYIKLLLDGLRSGTIYALVALGFVTVFNVTGVINFAQGAFVMLGAMLAVTFNDQAWLANPGLNLISAVVLAILVTTIVGAVVERIAIYPARDSDALNKIIITLGIYIIIQGIALLIWGTDSYQLPNFTTLSNRDQTFRWDRIILHAQTIWIWGVTALVMLVLYYFFEKTMIGRALRACSINRKAARLMGINPSTMSLIAFALAAALGAIGGIVVAPITRPEYAMGLKFGLKGFVSAVVGGLRNPVGAVIGGLMLGTIEVVGSGVTNAGFRDVYVFILLILVLLYRPNGILSSESSVEKV